MRASCRHSIYERPDAGAGQRGVRRHLWRTLQQGEHIKDAGLPARGCIPVAVKVFGVILPYSVH